MFSCERKVKWAAVRLLFLCGVVRQMTEKETDERKINFRGLRNTLRGSRFRRRLPSQWWGCRFVKFFGCLKSGLEVNNKTARSWTHFNRPQALRSVAKLSSHHSFPSCWAFTVLSPPVVNIFTESSPKKAQNKLLKWHFIEHRGPWGRLGEHERFSALVSGSSARVDVKNRFPALCYSLRWPKPELLHWMLIARYRVCFSIICHVYAFNASHPHSLHIQEWCWQNN